MVGKQFGRCRRGVAASDQDELFAVRALSVVDVLRRLSQTQSQLHTPVVMGTPPVGTKSDQCTAHGSC